jgi:hypothetical protein
MNWILYVYHHVDWVLYQPQFHIFITIVAIPDLVLTYLGLKVAYKIYRIAVRIYALTLAASP